MDNKDNNKKNHAKTLRYFSIGMNMIYTLCTPTILLLTLYFMFIEKKFGKQPLVLIGLIILGIISGYHSFFKLVKEMEK